MRTPSRKAVVAVACAIGLVAAGCTKSNSDKGISKGENQQNISAVKKLPSTVINTAARNALKDGGTVNIAISNYPQNFNLANLYGNSTGAALALEPIQATMFNYDGKGLPVIDHDYLRSAEVIKDEPFTVEFTLNPKAVWSDGTPMGYRDFQGEFTALSGKNPQYTAASHNGFDVMRSIRRGANDQDVIVTFNRTYAGWSGLFNGLLPRSLTATPHAFNDSWADTAPISGGPFVVDRADSTAKVVTLKPNPRWWGAKPKLTEINMRYLGLNAESGAFKNGEIDIVNASFDPDTLRTAEHVAGTRIMRATGAGWHLIDLNARSPLLKDPVLRKAISLAIPRDRIAKLREQPFDAPPVLLNNHILAVTQEGYQDNATAAIGPDQARAKKLFTRAGWKKIGKYLQKNGKTLTLDYPIPADTSSQTDVSQVVQKALSDVGVKVEIATFPTLGWFDQLNHGSFDIAYQGWTGGPFAECQMKSIFYPAISDQNKTGASSAKAGRLFDQACSTLDETKRLALVNELDRELFRIDTTLPLFDDPMITATKPDLANLASFFSAAYTTTRWQNVGWKK